MQNQNYKEAISEDIFSIIAKASEILEVKSYVIGGFVRDFILQRGTAKDIDVVTIGNGIALAKKVASLFFTSSASRLILFCLKSSAGDGKPAAIPEFIIIVPSPETGFGIKNCSGLEFIVIILQ